MTPADIERLLIQLQRGENSDALHKEAAAAISQMSELMGAATQTLSDLSGQLNQLYLAENPMAMWNIAAKHLGRPKD